MRYSVFEIGVRSQRSGSGTCYADLENAVAGRLQVVVA